MKLQYHKIRGVDKSVCTAEQKIAYNMASRIYGDIRFAKAWQQYDSGKVPAFLQNDWESKAIREYFTTWQRDYNKASAHYNEDAIFSALRAGLHDFICHHAPITVTHTSYINFAMNGVYYSYSLDNNPFFPFHYLKTPIDPKSETYSGDACMEESSKSWFTDPLIGFGCPDSEIESAAGAILSLLLAAPLSTIRHDTKRTRIPNAYDSGYHFENIPVKERRIKIDF